MIKSMTGFGQGVFENENTRVTVDIKTVNNRFLDIHVRLPAELSALEIGLKKRVQAALKRGRIDIVVALAQTSEVTYELNLPLLKGYLSALQRMQQELRLEGVIDLGMLARLPSAMQTANAPGALDVTVSAGVTAALDQALTTLTEMRTTEGRELAAELNLRLNLIESALPGIDASAHQLPNLYRERLQKRIQELLRDNAQLDEGRLAQEVAYLAERSDITEELARLRSHIIQFRETLQGQEEAGKKLDFLLQEMNRESNTILAKSGELEVSRIAIDIKSEIEKMREQVQNVE
ncbi:MAG: YicC/YloC family endoribonuclease [Acidobacteriota bacterium]